MAAPVIRPQRRRPPYLAAAWSYLRAWLAGAELPPGEWQQLDVLERSDRTVLIDRARRYGPVNKGFMENRLAIFVTGHELGRRLLKEHSDALQPVSIQLQGLFPKGFMRQMQGDCHRHYRQQLVGGINSLQLAYLIPELESIASLALADFADNRTNQLKPHNWASSLSEIATRMLVWLFFGQRQGQAECELLINAYSRLGPNGVVWNISSNQQQAYAELSSAVRTLPVSCEAIASHCLLSKLQTSQSLDDTMLGNLIYMVELGRYDLRGLLRWISKYATEQPEWLDQIHAEEISKPRVSTTLPRAFVREVLRLEQSERLMREVRDKFIFDGHFIPKGSLLRICMWEAHKDPQAFPQPFEFKPQRFFGEDTGSGRFSPFGLDHHLCPFAALSVELAVVFLRVLARDYRIQGTATKPAVRGPYHWQPPPSFAVSLQPRSWQADL